MNISKRFNVSQPTTNTPLCHETKQAGHHEINKRAMIASPKHTRS